MKVLQGSRASASTSRRPRAADRLDLAAQADVALPLRGGVAGRLCLGPDELRAVNPDLVVLEAPGYGVGPPCGHRPAFAPTMGAGSGLASGTWPAGCRSRRSSSSRRREAGGDPAPARRPWRWCRPTGSPVMVPDMLLGLLVQRRHGIGQAMSTSMLSTMAHVLSETMVEYDDIEPIPVADAELLGLGPWYRLYRCDKGWVFLSPRRLGPGGGARRVLGGRPARRRRRARCGAGGAVRRAVRIRLGGAAHPARRGVRGGGPTASRRRCSGISVASSAWWSTLLTSDRGAPTAGAAGPVLPLDVRRGRAVPALRRRHRLGARGLRLRRGARYRCATRA